VGTNRERLRELAGTEKAPAGSVDDSDAREFERIAQSLYMAVVAESIPRRLGGSVRSGTLALDKRVARKIANLYRTLWRAVDGEPPSWSSKAERLALAAEAPSEARRAGAVVRWPKWLKTRIEEVEQLRRAHAALALRDGRVRWGARRMRLLDQELENLKRIATETVLDERRYNGHDHSDT
jgi:hypothetical protein